MKKPKIQLRNPIKEPLEKSRQKSKQEALQLYQAIKPRVIQRIRTLRAEESNSSPQEILELLEEELRQSEIASKHTSSHYALAVDVFIVASLELRSLANGSDVDLDAAASQLVILKNSQRLKATWARAEDILQFIDNLDRRLNTDSEGSPREPIQLRTKPRAEAEFSDSLILKATKTLDPIALDWPKVTSEQKKPNLVARLFRR
jgi:hypothetical protein